MVIEVCTVYEINVRSRSLKRYEIMKAEMICLKAEL